PHAFDEIGKSLYRETMPAIVPTALLPAIEAYFNRSVFLDRPLIPEHLEKLLPEYQFQPYTTELSKAVGRAMATLPGMKRSEAASPILLENTIRGWTGGIGLHLLRLANFTLTKAGLLPERIDPSPTLADLPVIQGFTVRYPSAGAQSIQRFFERAGAKEQILATIRELAAQGDFESMKRELEIQQGLTIDPGQIRKTISEMSSLVRSIYRDPGQSPEEKRQLIDGLYLQMIDMAKLGNQMFDEVDKIRAASERAVE
ncbi:MAG: LPD38 domain-containing protein, partial [Vicinamibacteria bacterium]